MVVESFPNSAQLIRLKNLTFFSNVPHLFMHTSSWILWGNSSIRPTSPGIASPLSWTTSIGTHCHSDTIPHTYIASIGVWNSSLPVSSNFFSSVWTLTSGLLEVSPKKTPYNIIIIYNYIERENLILGAIIVLFYYHGLATLLRVATTEPKQYPYSTIPTSCTITEMTISCMFPALMSPYPTVVVVAMDQ